MKNEITYSFSGNEITFVSVGAIKFESNDNGEHGAIAYDGKGGVIFILSKDILHIQPL